MDDFYVVLFLLFLDVWLSGLRCFWIRDWASVLFLCKMVAASLLFDFWLVVVFPAVHFGVGNIEI